MDSLQVTVVIPVYNVSRYISACVMSVINQSYKNLEILLVDDGSPDDSIALAEAILMASNRNYRIIRQANGGVSAARNNGIAQAKGDLVIALDADDVLGARALETMVKAYEQNQVQCVVCSYCVIGDAHEYKEPEEKNTILVRSGKEACEKYCNRTEIYVSPAMLLSKAFLTDNHIVYDDKCRFAEDDLYVWNVLTAADKIAFCKQDLYGYVFHENSTMTSATYDRFVSACKAGERLYQEKISAAENALSIAAFFLGRHVFGVVHAAAKVLTYDAFKALLNEVDFKKYTSQLKKAGCKTYILTTLFQFSRKVFYIVCRKF